MSLPHTKSTVQRRVLILDKLNKHGQVDVISLSKELKVSEVTIRNDLTRLEQKKMLIRARGGAIKVDHVGIDFALSDKNKQHYEEKKRIGKAAAGLITDGDTIILDSGTTTMEITKNLSSLKELTVITNALNIASQLAEHTSANVIIPGGFLRKTSQSLVGATAETSLKNFFCDKLFLAVDGLDITYGLSTPNAEEAHLNRIMMSISKQVIVVADSSKFHKRSFAFIAPITEIDVIITDAAVSPEDNQQLENAGVQLIVV
ncbi:MAG: DeoR/GlpR transcriptional regulator [Chitinophagaceae bacterium]|nr:DeoR/GlpR transcriptional regulator [Chitinophagaceae bacterium]